ncbi:D-alanyl-D-alanine carboxypeptidase family protein [Bacillus sp. B1-b2]|uniref:D-alanyl-D-alanine carboxypeptidase family protein n=1 Tax=Bacillus sp. B1-b2 TaxID=2653201 RepID=UPI001261F5ED|nr:D-alanyl-D-alanine carboxypeptidase family protein [Bacillus sp. B1-b2]KAB7671141.1 D-alanyl-D-alanine carboxypeptidase [Bacillus sp. B1-b2]
MKILKVFSLIILLWSIPSISEAAESTEVKPQIISEAAFLLDNDTGAVLFQQNGDEKMYPASLTKIATAIYALEKGNLTDKVTISENAYSTDGTKVYLELGEEVTLKHLLEGMLVNSGNDAAVAIAEYLDGTVDQFAENINSFLQKKVKVKSTHFTNPSGLYNDNHYTTAQDLALITQYALKNPTFLEIFGTKELEWDGLTWDTTLISHHQMLNGERPYDGIIGGKTGYVNESKQTLATTAVNGDMNLTAIVLKADYKEDVYMDTKLLLDYGFANFTHSEISSNQNFSVEQTSYKLPANTEITVSKQNGKEEVTSSGTLLIESSEGDLLQTLSLEKVENFPLQASDVEVAAVSSNEQNRHIFIPILILGVMLVLGFPLIRWVQRRRI